MTNTVDFMTGDRLGRKLIRGGGCRTRLCMCRGWSLRWQSNLPCLWQGTRKSQWYWGTEMAGRRERYCTKDEVVGHDTR